MITIDKLSMDFKMDRLDFAKELYGTWEKFCRYSVERVMDETLSPFNRDHEVIEIDEMVIELGRLMEADFYKKFPFLFRQKLYEEFTRLLYQPDYKTKGKIRILSLKSVQLDTWIFFLQNGYVSSEFSELYRHPEQIFITLMEEDPSSVVSTLRREWHQYRLRRRLTEQLKDTCLLRIVVTEEPDQAMFIARFISGTQPLRLDERSGRGSPTVYRSILWIATFSFLFFNHQSIFSRKEYLRHTVKELSAHYNLNYKEILLLLLSCFSGMENDTTASAIQFILKELMEEEEMQTPKGKETRETTKETIPTEKPNPSLEKTKQLIVHFTNAIDIYLSDPKIRIKTIEKLRQLAELVENERHSFYSSKNALMEKLSTILQELSQLLKIRFRDLLLRLRESFSDEREYHIVSILNEIIQQKKEDKEHEIVPNVKRDANSVKRELLPKISEYSRITIENAGIVLLTPYLQRLFSTLKLTVKKQFVNTNTQLKAIFLLQELLCDNRTEYHEPELFLNKLLVGYTDNSDLLPLSVTLSEHEKSTCRSLLEGCKDNWPALKNTCVESFCESFVRRNGRLEKMKNHWSLRVEEMSYDILLDRLPWIYSPVKYPWMDEPIYVQWR